MLDPFEARKVLFRAAKAAACLWIIGIILDIGMMIVSIMAYTGAQDADDSAVIRRTFITFPTAGRHVQRTEIALASLGLLVNPTLLTVVLVRTGRLRRETTRANAGRVKCAILSLVLPWHLACLAVWAVCIAFQAAYVPIMGAGKLPECVRYGGELSQCGLVSASWIVAMSYCALHLFSLATLLAMLYCTHCLDLPRRADISTAAGKEGHSNVEPSRSLEDHSVR